MKGIREKPMALKMDKFPLERERGWGLFVFV